MAIEKALKTKVVEEYRPKLGSEGYVIEAMTARQKTKNNVIIDGEAYHAYAVDALIPYSRVTVVGYKTGYLKVKEQLRFLSSSVFEHQPDATISVTDPESGQKYEWKDKDGNPLGTQKNVRIISIYALTTWTGQPTPLEIHVTIDGVPHRFFVNDPVSGTSYQGEIFPRALETAQLLTTASNLVNAFLLEGRSVKVEVEITGGTVSDLKARIKWAKM